MNENKENQNSSEYTKEAKAHSSDHADKSEISLEDIYLMLLDIKQMIKKTLRDENKIEKITEEYENRLYDDISDWQNAIWSSCKYKKEKQGSDSIYFYCTLLKDVCSFERCPLNRIDNDKGNEIKNRE